ncbi:UNVERIFIED_CONTAM: hypothetical protein PYX00_003944 [Menopon gallinae]|uniref:Uncharacterized protein n=1 Tax=Menopon gallinae TaxID=328185 RepID=A0AAW2I1Y2_9NEOP
MDAFAAVLLVLLGRLSASDAGVLREPYTPFHPDLVRPRLPAPPAALLDNPDVAYFLPIAPKAVVDDVLCLEVDLEKKLILNHCKKNRFQVSYLINNR